MYSKGTDYIYCCILKESEVRLHQFLGLHSITFSLFSFFAVWPESFERISPLWEIWGKIATIKKSHCNQTLKFATMAINCHFCALATLKLVRCSRRPRRNFFWGPQKNFEYSAYFNSTRKSIEANLSTYSSYKSSYNRTNIQRNLYQK